VGLDCSPTPSPCTQSLLIQWCKHTLTIHSCIASRAHLDAVHAGFQEGGSVKEAVAASLVIQLKACEVRVGAEHENNFVREVRAAVRIWGGRTAERDSSVTEFSVIQINVMAVTL
jgi:hypothetical protein